MTASKFKLGNGTPGESESIVSYLIIRYTYGGDGVGISPHVILHKLNPLVLKILALLDDHRHTHQ